jgi:hypothetical protein
MPHSGGLVPEHALAVATGGAAVVDGSEASEHFGADLFATSAAMHPQRQRLRPGRRQWRRRWRGGALRPATPRVDHTRRCRQR